MEAILQWDGQALLFIQEHIRQVWMDGFWKTITHLGDAGWFWIILGIVLLIPKKTRKAGIAALAALAIGALITNVALKNIIENGKRIRPYEVVEGLKLLIEPQSDFSFPSGHTCASIGAALAMYPFLERKWGIPLVILAVLISLSRLYVGVHYPTDVLGGAVVGNLLCCMGRKWVRIVKHGLVRKAKKAEKRLKWKIERSAVEADGRICFAGRNSQRF